MRIKITFATLFYLMLFFNRTHAQNQTDTSAINSTVKNFMRNAKVPGAAIAIVKNGQPLYVKAYGISNLELNTPVTRKTVFELASVTKQMTAALIVTLADEGIFSLDDEIGKYVKDGKEEWKAITIRQLLGHKAGLKMSFEPKTNDSYLLNYSTELMLKGAKETPMNATPGTDWEYSDQGYFLAGLVAERATGRTFSEMMTDKFFKPIGMTYTRFLDQDDIIENRADGYIIKDGQFKNNRRSWEFELAPHFGVMSTIDDMVLYENALSKKKVVEESVLNEISKPYHIFYKDENYRFSYGLGWEVHDFGDRRIIQHSGFTGTAYVRDLKSGIAVIILTNRNAYDGPHPFILAHALAKLADKSFPDFPKLED